MGKDSRRVNASLVLVQNDGSQKEIPLSRVRTVIGRETSCQIRIPVPAVSRQHCEVTAEGEKIVLKDLGSSNGTFVNRRRVSHTELAAGDIIGVGPAVFAVRVDGKPGSIDAATILKQAAQPTPGSAPVGAGQAKQQSLLDDLEENGGGTAGSDDSSVADFDFLDDDEDDQPKL